MTPNTFSSQLRILLYRNYLLQTRYWRATLAQLGAPLLFMLILHLLQQVDYASQLTSIPHPPLESLPGVYNCHGPTLESPCVNVLFWPLNEKTSAFMRQFAQRNAQRTGEPEWSLEELISDLSFEPTQRMGMVPVPSKDFIYNYALHHPNVTQWAVTFVQSPGPPNPTVEYQIYYNASLTASGTDIFGLSLLSFLRGLDEAIISVLKDPSLKVSVSLDVNLKDWPLVPSKVLSDSIVQNLGPVFFFCCVMVIFISALNTIVDEKEARLRIAMDIMGLYPSVYWCSYLLSNSLLISIGSLLTGILGRLFGFKAFTETHFFVIFLTFFLLGEAMLVFAFFISTFIRKSRTAILVGIFIFVIGLVFESFVFSSGFIGYIWWNPTETLANQKNILYLVPFFNFGKMFLDITTYTTGKLDELTNTFIPGPGFPYDALYHPIPIQVQPIYGDGTRADIPPPIDSIYLLLMNIAMYSLLTLYFDRVIPDEYGARLQPWFFLTRTFWGWKDSNDSDSYPVKGWLEKMKKEVEVQSSNLNEDIAVSEEKKSVLDVDHSATVKIFGLSKVYKTSSLCPWRMDCQVALKPLFLSFEKGKVLALLGQNGAGKTTTLNILSGLTPPSSGDALMCGYSVKTQMHRIRKILGVCPQHDILFEELTAREHIYLYAGLKSVPRRTWNKLITERLGAVKLDKVADLRVGTFSGGMKRRLSLVISTIGDPEIVFLDEPTTGIDPVNRRHVWSFIEKFKVDRTIVLTTHSMEEADVLGDRIAIMVHGKLCAIGNSIQLKTRFGNGYRISIMADRERLQEAKEFVTSKVASAILEDDSAGALIYQFPFDNSDCIPRFIRSLDEEDSGLIRSWGLSQTSLEEVFLGLVRQQKPSRLDYKTE